MTQKVKTLLFLLMFGLTATCAFAGELDPGARGELVSPGTPIRKLQRGFLNIALSPFDIAYQFHEERNRQTFPPSWFLAMGRGSCYAIGRALTGVYEMVTFPFPYPANYEPVIQPEFAWQNFKEEPEKVKRK